MKASAIREFCWARSFFGSQSTCRIETFLNATKVYADVVFIHPKRWLHPYILQILP